MVEKALIRNMEKSDIKFMADLVNRTWGMKRSERTWASLSAGYFYVYESLAKETFTCVAERNGKPVGFITGHSNKHVFTHPVYLAKALYHALRLLCDDTLVDERNAWRDWEKDVKKLKNSLKCKFEGQVELFMTAEDERGNGTGLLLFSKMLDYFRQNNIKSFYLDTDDECNWPFYEKAGLKRLAQTVKDFGIYLYGNDGTVSM